MAVNNYKKCIIWGAGYCGRIALEVYGRERVICYADTYKAGQTIEDVYVISYSQMCEEVKGNKDICVVIASEEHYKEMQKSLIDNEINNYVIFFPFHSGKIQNTIKHNKDIFDESIYTERCIKPHSQLKIFKDIHKDRRIFLVGNGPSLSSNDLDILHDNNDISFGFNKIYRIFEKTAWRPDYYGFTDFFSYKINMNAVENMPGSIFLWDVFEDLIENEKKENVYYFNFMREPFYPELPMFSEDITKGTYLGNSVTYDIGFQFAAYMGAKEIYLLGMDHEYASTMTASKSHFCGYFEEKEKNMNFPLYENKKVELAFEAAKEYAKEHDIKIYNATRGGKLEMFERVDFDELFTS